MENTKKITKREVVNMMLADAHIAKNETFKTFLEHELELLEKKSDKTSKVDEQKAKADAELREVILTTLAEGQATITEMQGKNEILAGKSNQKITALLRIMASEGEVIREVIKRKATFRLAE